MTMDFKSLLKKLAKPAAEQIKKEANTFRDIKKKYTFDQLPQNAEELKALPEASCKDPFAVAALTVAALCRYPQSRDDCIEMLNVLKGPQKLTPTDLQFIRDRFMDGKDYIPRSYLNGAKPENNYTPSQPFTVEVIEGAHSRDNEKEGYLMLFLTSGGADSPRYLKLRNKPSTGEWFLWTFEGILSGIRIPVKDNAWA